MHPAVSKARFIGKIAHAHDWKGEINSDVVGTERVTSLTGRRNDESFFMYWTNEKLTRAGYSITIDGEAKNFRITHSKEMLEKITGWPDLIKLYKWFPNANRPKLTETYRKLPFSMDEDNETIIEKLTDTKLFWYGHETTKIHEDVVKRSKKNRIVDVGHRKLFHFIGAQAGFRSVLLDTVLKVA